MAKLGEVFGGAGGAFGSGISGRPTLKRYTVLEEANVRKTEDVKSAKVAVLQPGETIDVVKIGATNKQGRTRLRIAEPAGWVSDKNKAGKTFLSEVAEAKGWSMGSIDMSSCPPTSAAAASAQLAFHAPRSTQRISSSAQVVLQREAVAPHPARSGDFGSGQLLLTPRATLAAGRSRCARYAHTKPPAPATAPAGP
jgi:hypothetical protein